MLCIGYGREAAARRMRGLSPRREPLIRLRYREGTFSHKGRREEEPAAYIPLPNLIQRNDARAIRAHLGPLEHPKGAVP